MKSAWLLSAGLALALLPTSAWCQQMDFDKVQIITEKLGPNVYTALAGGSACSPGPTAS
jgi:hypothetical protein